MRTVKLLGVVAVFVFGAVALLQCTTDNNLNTPDAGDVNREQRGVGCDPDQRAPCMNDVFYCENDDQGNKRCEGQTPAVPDGGDWNCEEDNARHLIICTGTPDGSPPGEDSGWVCEDNGDGTYTCRRHSYFPEGGGDGYWDCYYEGEFRICTFHENGGSDGDGDVDGDGDSDSDADIGDDGGVECPPGVEFPTDEWCGGNSTPDGHGDGHGDGVDNDCDGRVDEGCGDNDSGCVCTPGAWRYCDTPDYCLWGQQFCDEDGMAWGPCVEIAEIPPACAAIANWYSPAAEACCIEQGRCCQDMWDLDHDGDTMESLPNGCPEISCEWLEE